MIRVSKILIVIGLYTLSFLVLSKLQKAPTLNRYAEMVVKRCNLSKIKNFCYEAEIPKLMRDLSMEDTFDVIQMVQDKDSLFLNCHNVAHRLSEIESKRVGWQNTALHCPLAKCNYGCLHGAFAGRFRGETLDQNQISQVLPEILSVCEPRPGYTPSDIDLAMCYHGIGHLAMYITGGSPERSISICEEIKTKSPGISYTNLCAEGVFMTVFHGQETPEDIALVKYVTPKKEVVPAFCNKFGSYWNICRRESYGLYSQDKKTAQSIENFCSYSKDKDMKEYCYLGIIGLFATDAFSKPGDPFSVIESFCKGFSKENQNLCFSGISMKLLQSDPLRYAKTANQICALSEKYGVSDRCYKDVIYYAGFIFGKLHPKERETYCANFPGKWQKSCLYKN